MGSFKKSMNTYARIDFQIIDNGWCQLYLKRGLLGEHTNWLAKEGYEIQTFECRGWNNLFHQFKEKMFFPDYARPNLDVFNDCLEDMVIKGIGMAIVLKRLDLLQKENAHSLLEILISKARRNFIFGKRLLILAQVDDPDFLIAPIGAIAINWNSKEWTSNNRQV